MTAEERVQVELETHGMYYEGGDGGWLPTDVIIRVIHEAEQAAAGAAVKNTGASPPVSMVVPLVKAHELYEQIVNEMAHPEIVATARILLELCSHGPFTYTEVK